MAAQQMLKSFVLFALLGLVLGHAKVTGVCIHKDHEGHDHDDDRGLRIASVFIVLVASFAGAVLPVLTKRFCPDLDQIYYSCGKVFGAGIILSTAFVHMFSPANLNLTNPCLSDAFIKDFTAYAGLFALLAIVVVHFFQVMASIMVEDQLRAKRSAEVDLNKKSSSAPLHVEDFHAETTAGKEVEGGHGHGHGLHQHGATDAGHSHSLLLDSRIEKRVGVYILEAGIASHSIIIGIALGVEEEEFKVLLIAIVFHQFFEGIALSTVVLESLTSKIKIAFMVLLFSITTPVGVSIALGIRETYSDTDPTTLYVTGVLDSVASGILIYDSLVNIIAPHFSSPEFRAATNMRRATQLGFLWLGVALMSILGIWA